MRRSSGKCCRGIGASSVIPSDFQGIPHFPRKNVKQRKHNGHYRTFGSCLKTRGLMSATPFAALLMSDLTIMRPGSSRSLRDGLSPSGWHGGQCLRLVRHQATTAVITAVPPASRMTVRAIARCRGMVKPPVPSSMVLTAATNMITAHARTTTRTARPPPVARRSENSIVACPTLRRRDRGTYRACGISDSDVPAMRRCSLPVTSGAVS